MSAIITVLQTAFEGVLEMAQDTLTFITTSGNELLLMFVILPIIGIGVGLLTRLFRLRG